MARKAQREAAMRAADAAVRAAEEEVDRYAEREKEDKEGGAKPTDEGI